MKSIKNLVEYYDELFPVSSLKKSFYSEFAKTCKTPVHFLSVDCGTGFLESSLAREGHDVTGIENVEELLQSANLRRRSQLMSIRFFQMEKNDMPKFLGKSFYNVISVLNSRIMFFTGADSIRDFFITCRKLVAEGGIVVLETINFEKYGNSALVQLKTRESVRAKLFSEILTSESGTKTISMNLENSSGKIIPILNNIQVHPVLPSEIETLAMEAGFSHVEFYGDFDESPFAGNEDFCISVIS